jgi:xanthosine utilization system XapX-like protein
MCHQALSLCAEVYMLCVFALQQNMDWAPPMLSVLLTLLIEQHSLAWAARLLNNKAWQNKCCG